jgi:hypothetical protein
MRPSFAVPAAPIAASARERRTAAVHAPFFSGEVPLSNGVYYLKFPSGAPLGYYSYLSDAHYVYHFDLGYEYVFDSTDANAVYLYDFASGHFWYTGANIFPYVYDFALKSFLYYYPDSNNADHYTKSPRYFFNFATGKIITVPSSDGPSRVTVATTTQIDPGNVHYLVVTFTNKTTGGVNVDYVGRGACSNAGSFCTQGPYGWQGELTLNGLNDHSTFYILGSPNTNQYPTVPIICHNAWFSSSESFATYSAAPVVCVTQ